MKESRRQKIGRSEGSETKGREGGGELGAPLKNQRDEKERYPGENDVRSALEESFVSFVDDIWILCEETRSPDSS